MALIPTVECALHNRVGFAKIDIHYTVDDVQYDTRVVLYNSDGTQQLQMDEYRTRQFSGLTASTTYQLKTIYGEVDEYGEYVAIGTVPDTEVTFQTKANAYYTPDAVIENGSISVSELPDSIWYHDSQLVNGFGVGVELLDMSDNILASSFDTPCDFNNVEDGQYKVRAFVWTGTPNNRRKVNVISGTTVEIEAVNRKLSVFTFPLLGRVEMHIRLEGFRNPSKITVLNQHPVTVWEEITEDVRNNHVYAIKLTGLEPDDGRKKLYAYEVQVTDGEEVYTESGQFWTVENKKGEPKEKEFKDFWISVGPMGAYTKDRSQYSEPFGMNKNYHFKVKHAPYSVMPKIKNVVVQSWKDEDGDDVWLPRATSTEPGIYIPAITHEAVEYNVKFVYFESNESESVDSKIRSLLKRIEGHWLIIHDEYTGIAFEGAYLVDVDDDPKFKRRNYDHFEFTLKFKVNHPNIQYPFRGIEK